MITEEQKKALSITISKREYERLIDNEQQFFFYKRKFIEEKHEKDELIDEVKKLQRLVYASDDEKEMMMTEQFNHIINEIELITDRKEIHKLNLNKGSHFYQEQEYNNIISKMRKLLPNDRTNTNKNYIFSRIVYDRRGLICPNCNARMKVYCEYPDYKLSLVDNRIFFEDMIFCGFKCQKCKFVRPNLYSYSRYNNTVLNNKVITDETISNMIEKKYSRLQSFVYQETDWKDNDIELSYQTMISWVKEAGEKWLNILYDMLHKEIIRSDLVYAEAYLYRQYKLSENNLMMDSDKPYYIWVYRTDHYNNNKIILFESTEFNDAEESARFLKGYSGMIQTSIPEYYSKVSRKVKFAVLWQRVGEIIERALESIPESAQKGSYANEMYDLYNKLINLEGNVSGMDADIKYRYRITKCKPIIDRMIANAHNFINMRKSPDKIGHTLRIFEYILQNENALCEYINDPRIELDDGWCSNPANYFTDFENGGRIIETPSGYEFSLKLYSIIKTIEANNLNPTRYLTFFFKNISNIKNNADTDFLLPWNVPEECFELFSE